MRKKCPLILLFALLFSVFFPANVQRTTVAKETFSEVIRTDFEDGSAQGWQPWIGKERLTVTEAEVKTGKYSLLTTGRQHAYSGPALNVYGKIGHHHKVYLTSIRLCEIRIMHQ